MSKLTIIRRILVLATLGLQTAHGSVFAQSTPNMSGEDAFLEEAQARMNRLNEQNRRMIEEDRSIMQEGYDPNEVNPNYSSLPHQNEKPHWNRPNAKK